VSAGIVSSVKKIDLVRSWIRDPIEVAEWFRDLCPADAFEQSGKRSP
jgi:hypothetical protein